jgi:hypothetical protein
MEKVHERKESPTMGAICRIPPVTESSSKLIIALWDHHLLHIWMLRNGVVRANGNGQTVCYKVEELARKMDAVWMQYEELQGQIKDFQRRHFRNRETIKNTRHDSKACRVTLSTLFLDETEHRTPSNFFPLESFLEMRFGVG